MSFSSLGAAVLIAQKKGLEGLVKLVVVSIRDSAVDAFMRPFFVPTPAMAVRSFSDEVKRSESELARHPEDYELFQVAEFDEETGKFFNLESPRSLMRGSDVKERL